ncbi:TPM domain-containing protein [candidate division KSB1 bacterium]
MKYRKILSALCLILLVGIAGVAPVDAQYLPRSSTFVTDQAGVLPADIEQQLNGFLQELEQKTTAQVLVLTIDRVPEGAIEDFALNQAEAWGLGRKGVDNGLLLVVAVADRKYRFEVGYGLEGLLPDSYVGSIGRQYMVPYFRKGDYGSGTALAALAVAHKIAEDKGVTITGMPELPRMRSATRSGRRTGGGVGGLIFLIIMMMLLGRGGRGGRGSGLLWLLLGASMMGGPRRGGWTSGGGGGGGFGGFGSFGGGGGGGFGGGGASGSW